MLMAVVSAVKARYTINAVLLDQGTTDFVERTSEDEYRSDLKSMIDIRSVPSNALKRRPAGLDGRQPCCPRAGYAGGQS